MALESHLHRLLYRLAQAYYLEDLTQQQIAERFALSRTKVSRLLTRARDEGIVRISLQPPPSDASQLESQLERRFGLDEAIVVAVNAPDSPDAVARELAPAAAAYLLRMLVGNETVAVAGGASVRAMVDALPTRSFPRLTVVQMAGGMGPTHAPDHATEVARRLASKLEARLTLLAAPGLVSSAHLAAELRTDAQIQETLEQAARADLALVGLGLLTPQSALVYRGTRNDLEDLNRAGAVGNIGYRCINALGEPLHTEFDERIVGLSLEQIVAIPRVVGIAGGVVKLALIQAALRAHVLRVLITDQGVAEALLAG